MKNYQAVSLTSIREEIISHNNRIIRSRLAYWEEDQRSYD